MGSQKMASLDDGDGFEALEALIVAMLTMWISQGW
jgi:hypothetical protein